MREVGIGLLGFGTVGSGFVTGLLNNGDLLSTRVGIKPVLRRVADIDIETDRGIPVPAEILTRDARAVIADPAVDIVVELIGGTGVAREFVLEALRAGKPVVTANKALLAKHGDEVFAAAAESGVDIYFSASVGGGIPVIRALREGLIANRITRIYGILNGTCNYILTRMTNEGLPFDTVLAEAQALGYAEANPALDIDGFDTAHKAAILAALAYGRPVPLDNIPVEGIRALDAEDVRRADELAHCIKLLAVVEAADTSVDVRVQPMLVPKTHMLAGVSGVFNAVIIDGDMTGTTMYYGRGAGAIPTAATVMADVTDIARNLASGCPRRVPPISPSNTVTTATAGTNRAGGFYLRVTGEGEALESRVAEALTARGIAAETVRVLREKDGAACSVIVLTREAPRTELEALLAEMKARDDVSGSVIIARIVE